MSAITDSTDKISSELDAIDASVTALASSVGQPSAADVAAVQGVEVKASALATKVAALVPATPAPTTPPAP